MSQISEGGLNHYTVMNGVNCRKVKDSFAGHWSVHYRSMKDCFNDIHIFGVEYERAKGYCKADFDSPEVSTINKVKSTKDPGLCYRGGGTHFQNRCTKDRISLITNPKAHHLHDKTTKELIICKMS